MENEERLKEQPGAGPKDVATPVEATEPMTEEQFLDEGHALIEKGKKAGLPVYALMLRLGVRQGSGWVEQGLAFIQSGTTKTGKR